MKAIAHKIAPVRIGLGRKMLRTLEPIFIQKLGRQIVRSLNIQLVDELFKP